MTHQRPVIALIRVVTLSLIGGFASTVGAASPSNANSFYLKDGDRVVFYGDSITDQRLYTAFIETYVVTRFPAMNVSFTHSGLGGDNVTGGAGGNIDTRLERDVYAYNPTVMTIMLGMNDGSFRAFDQKAFNTYRNGLTSIVDKVHEKIPGLRFTLIQPSAYDDVTREPKFPGGYNDVLVRFGAAVKEIAKAKNQNVADLNTPVVAMLQKAKTANPALAVNLLPDRTHPGAAGQLIMASALLKSWNAPSIVTDVAIDAAARKITRADNTQLSELRVNANGNLTWTQLDAALPMPVDMGDARIALAVNSSDFTAALNRQLLCVTGLTAADYDLSIDGKLVGRFTPAQLAGGVNLAPLATPIAAQAADVHKLTILRTNLHFTYWRAIQVPYSNVDSCVKPHVDDAAKAFHEAEYAAWNRQRTTARPVPRHYEIKPAIPPTHGNVKYGPEDAQIMDVWLAKSDAPTPAVIYIHGGGWEGGSRQGVFREGQLQSFLNAGISVVAIDYRFITPAIKAGIQPPVKWPLLDAMRAIQFVRSKAGEWNLDKVRIGVTGGSAGGCTSLWLAMHDDMAVPQSSDPVARESTRVACAGVFDAQSSLDPKQLREWFKDPTYGAHAFGFTKKEGEQETLRMGRCFAARERILPWIREYSPIELASNDDPAIFLAYGGRPEPAGQPQLNSVHGAAFGLHLKERLDALGVECHVAYPVLAQDPDAPHIQFLIKKLR